MNADEAFEMVRTRQPRIVYVSGKTSTGKTTFARRLQQAFGYSLIELDTVVSDDVITPLALPDRGKAFNAVYKNDDQPDLIKAFLAGAQQRIAAQLEAGKPVVIDGAVVNPHTLKKLLAPYPGLLFLYFHPGHLPTYERYLTERFKLATPTHEAGLPLGFWERVNDAAFAAFCKTSVINPGLQRAIHSYAEYSQHSSTERIATFRQHFSDIHIVQVR